MYNIRLGSLLFLAVLRQLSAQTVAGPAVSFLPAMDTLVGTNPICVVTGDFNRDGNQDIAVSNNGSSSISILLGLGNGKFRPGIITTVAGEPQTLVTGDFNGDGQLDLAMVNSAANSVSILLGNGNGTFRPPISTNVSSPTALGVADFNGDGRLDLAVATGGSSGIVILFGRGNGTFSTGGTFAAGLNPASLVLGDFNGDGKVDIAVANGGSTFISILLGNGLGAFQAPRNINVGGSLVSIVAADFNRDGHLDLAVLASSGAASPIIVLLGNGDATFQEPQRFLIGGNPVLLPIPWVGSISQPVLMAAADLNSDSIPDLAVGLGNSSSVSILIGMGDGSFEPAEMFSAGGGPSAIALTDFNADGKTDLAVANVESNSVSVLVNATIPRQPSFVQSAVVNAASFLYGPLAPGEIVTVFGSYLGPPEITVSQPSQGGFLPTTLAGTRLFIDGLAAPMLYVSATQISAVVPYEIGGKSSVQLRIESNAGVSNFVELPAALAAPALFSSHSTGTGQGVALNQDGTPNDASNPATFGSVVTLFGTGIGQTSPAGVDGIVMGSVPPVPLQPVFVTIGAVRAETLSVTAVPGQVAGLFQVQARIPSGISPGDVPVVITADNVRSQPGIGIRVEQE